MKMEWNKFSEVLERYAKAFWPAWSKDVDGDLLGLWYEKLKEFDEIVIVRGLKDYHSTREGSFKVPKLYEVLASCKRAKFTANGEESSKGGGVYKAYDLKCVGHPIEGRVGQLRPFMVTRGEEVGDRNKIMLGINEMAHKFGGMYGGEWVVVYSEEFAKAIGFNDEEQF